MKNAEIMQEVADRVVEMMQDHGTNWVKPWTSTSNGAVSGFPRNVASGKNYRGINIMLLLGSGHSGAEWGTFKQWKAKGASVRRGSKGTKIVFWKRLDKRDDEGNVTSSFWMLKTYNVFNAEQVDGYAGNTVEDAVEAVDVSEERCEDFDAMVETLGVDLRFDESSAYYAPMGDFVNMPDFSSFNGTDTSTQRETYYSTLAHEITHWTGGKKRLDRLTSCKFGDKDYAFEELVAELGAVFLTMTFGISPAPRPDHAKYLNNWVAALKETPQVIFAASKQAQGAMDYITAKEKG